jgi:hypothetical protein
MADNWQSPTGASGTNWFNHTASYDENESSQAFIMTSGSSYLELTRADLFCDKIRFKLGTATPVALYVDIQVYYDGAYNACYNGIFTKDVWVEKNVVPGSPGQAKTVSKVKIQLTWAGSNQGKVFEMDFNQAVVQSVIPNMMKHYKNRRAA